MITPLVSVITATYNTDPAQLEECLRSMLSQSYERWEQILVDDGSSDRHSGELQALVRTLGDPRFRIERLAKNQGMGIAINRGLDVSLGDIVTLLDADDMFLPWHLEEIVGCFSDPACEIVHTHNVLYIPLPLGLSVFAFTSYDALLPQDRLPSADDVADEPLAPRFAFRKRISDRLRFDSSIDCQRPAILQMACLGGLAGKVFQAKSGYLYRNHRSHGRLRYMLREIMLGRSRYFREYSGKHPEAERVVDAWKKNNPFCRYCDYLSSASLFSLSRKLRGLPVSERIQCIRIYLLMRTQEFSAWVTGGDLHYYSNLLRIFTGRHCKAIVREQFSRHLAEHGRRSPHAEDLYRRLFG